MADERKRKFFSGRSVEQAVVAAASYHGIDPSEVDYHEIEKRHGFVRTRRKAVISVDPDHPRRAPAAAAETKKREAEARPAERGERQERPRRKREPEAAPTAPAAAPEASETKEVTEPAEGERDGEEGREREARPRRERRGRGRGRGTGEGRRGERQAKTPRKPSEAAAPTPPWWLAEPVDEETAYEPKEPEEDAAADEEEIEEEVEEKAAGGRSGEEDDGGPARRGRERAQRGRRSEGLQRRTPPGEGPAAGAGGGGGTERRGRGRGRRGRGPEAAGESRRRPGGRSEAAPVPSRVPLPPEPRIPRSERLPREEGELADAAREALERLLEFVDVEAQADFYRDGERLEIELWGPDDQILLEEDGQLLLAIEHLLPRMIRGIYGDALPVRVDCADFHADREDRLRELARRTADEVRRRGRPRTLEEMDPAERRIVHITLEDDPDVTTESIGDGYFKKLKVLPA